jgi:hypothetical protein
MAKKSSSRPKTKPVTKKAAVVEAPVEPVVEEVAPAVAPAEPRPRRAAKLSRAQAASEELEEEYAYITGDLRRVFILAAIMFALLIVANVVWGMVAG